MDGEDEGLGARFLVDEPARAGPEGVEHDVGVPETREGKHAGRRRQRAQRGDEAAAVVIGHVHLDDHHVRGHGRADRERGIRCCRLADDLEQIIRGDRLPRRRPRERIAVHDDDRAGHRGVGSVRRDHVSVGVMGFVLGMALPRASLMHRFS